MQNIKHNFKLYLKSNKYNFNASEQYKDRSKTDQKLQAKILSILFQIF